MIGPYSQFSTAGLALLFLIAVVVFSVRAWKNRSKKQKDSFDEPGELLLGADDPLYAAEGMYVATTYCENKLDRITAYGLGFRGNGAFLVCRDGIQIYRDGERDLAISKSHILAIEPDQATIDRAVEKDGLLRIDWTAEAATLSTFIRIVDDRTRKEWAEFANKLTK